MLILGFRGFKFYLFYYFFGGGRCFRQTEQRRLRECERRGLQSLYMDAEISDALARFRFLGWEVSDASAQTEAL